MKQIKFRVWHKDYKEIMYPPLADLENFYIALIDGQVYEVWENDTLRLAEDIAELMQFTGLVDCEGKEIYEGDIIEYKSFGRYVVEFYGGSFISQCLEVHGTELFMFNIYLLIEGADDDNKCSSAKIIGNKFENPELMERK